MKKEIGDTIFNGTPFDDVFKTLLINCSRLIIPVLNEVFNTDYELDEPVTLLSDGHYFIDEEGSPQKRLTDSCIMIRKKLYHLECESTVKSSIEIRMVEYDFHVALSHLHFRKGMYVLKFPESAVLMLRHTKNTPKQLKLQLIMPNKKKVTYRIPVVKVQSYTKEDIFNKNLLFFIPYYILRFEKRLKKIDSDTSAIKNLSAEYEDIYERLRMLESKNILDQRYPHDLISLTNRLIEVVTRNTNNVKREMMTMGGQVLELESEKLIKQGIDQGKLDSIFELLAEYGDIPNELKKKLSSEANADKLNIWLKLAARVSSIEEFLDNM